MDTKDKKYTFVFDFDGTLVDSMGYYIKSVVRVLEENNIDYPEDLFKIITPLGYIGSAKYFVEKLGLNMTVEEACDKMKEIGTKAYETQVAEKETVTKTLMALKERGHRLSVLTASPHSNLDPCLKRLGMWDFFDRVWSCEDFNTVKSDVNIYRLVAKELGISVKDCIFLDDNINAVLTAKQAGMYTVGVYDETSADYEEEMRSAADKYIYRFEELLK